MNKPWKYDVNVLIIFFVRDKVLEKTFESVRQARPRRLLLWQDGAREGRSDDIEAIDRCRKIVENIDWECEVYKNYQTKNWGCDPSTFYSHKWAFSLVDKCIVLEDDCCPTQSFFPYCKELLDKYETDQRINRICGMNNLGISQNCPDDYFFTRYGSVWGWATWKRVADSWQENYPFIGRECEYYINQLRLNLNDPDFEKYWMRVLEHSETGNPYWETIQSMRKLLTSSYDIVPKYNMIRSLGVAEESTHSASNINVVPTKFRKLFYEQQVYNLEFPLKHPSYLVENIEYATTIRKLSKHTFYTRCESFVRHLLYGDLYSLLLRKLQN